MIENIIVDILHFLLGAAGLIAIFCVASQMNQMTLRIKIDHEELWRLVFGLI